ncbi:hypothetical protein CkaCkLH20_12887 [Colletotrichum karsti]|uniref:Uncharacterized protein n=1 Tax=Colletotrichum karsti TaxID=1095194 RepID=A0A9P6LEM7_9PEZI|nr:uncharacterized protein CkaCkLH20_12887 [Colletotrichum karsti]KAF9869700.1 hypothetical protein CkaCkLH20_12887 [Colletotrichum karsti]
MSSHSSSQRPRYRSLDGDYSDDDEFMVGPPMTGITVPPHLKIIHIPPNNDDAHTPKGLPKPGCGTSMAIAATQLATWISTPVFVV